ncbi:hypothetical protein NC652_041553 [Populus alba x Populus x berolinensis]|nr:hypothetical protein NC652_041553 [Populus alba x Populus x berolinensis]
MFANECREDKNGLDRQNVEQSKKSGGVQIAATQSSLFDAHSRPHRVVTPIIIDG